MTLAHRSTFLQAALNGDREHPAVPRSPSALAAEGRAAVDAGAVSLHVHPYDDDGRETLAAAACAETLRAVRAACPGVPVSLTTSATVEPDPERRLALVAAWTELPDLVTANQGEDGIVALSEALIARGVGVEAGLLSLGDAHAFVSAGLARRCVRAMVEPLDADPEAAVDHAAAIERVLADAGVELEQVHHGDGVASWAVNRRALGRGHGIRTGLEDTPVLPDGRRATGNGELVATAVRLAAELGVPTGDAPRETLVRSLYRAFNLRDIDAVLAALTADVDWPNGWEGGRVVGHAGVRDYWQRQWAEVDPTVEPTAIGGRPDGTVEVAVHQVVRDRAGGVLSEGPVRHVYAFRGALVRRMTIELEP